MVIFAFEGEGSVPKSPVKIQARPYIRAFVENCPYNARIFVILPLIPWIVSQYVQELGLSFEPKLIGSIENTWLIQIYSLK